MLLETNEDTNNVLTFRVKHFPGKPQLIESEYVRYLIFMQIRNYLLKGDLQLPLTDETRLAAYAVQAYLGDYDPDIHHEHYLTEVKFLPQKSLKAEETIVQLHKELAYVVVLDLILKNLKKKIKTFLISFSLSLFEVEKLRLIWNWPF